MAAWYRQLVGSLSGRVCMSAIARAYQSMIGSQSGSFQTFLRTRTVVAIQPPLTLFQSSERRSHPRGILAAARVVATMEYCMQIVDIKTFPTWVGSRNQLVV